MSLFSAGQRLNNRFTLITRIGAGGMSEVWRATDELLGRPVAVKALAAPLASDPELREATWREARAVARLNHPHIAQVHDYGQLPLPGRGDGAAGYLVMELVEGESLADRLRHGPLPWPEAVRTGQRVAAALAAAHRLGVVHRDVKPGNVMLTDAGVKVLDFGIAAVAGRVDTDPGRLVGTPSYAAPERLDVTVPAQPASDIYSLGVMLYELLVGRPPAQLRDWPAAAALHQVGLDVPQLLVAGLPPTVAATCRACLSPDPAERPAASQLVATLAAAVGEPVPVTAAAGSGSSDPAPTVPRPGRFASGAAPLPVATEPTRLDGAGAPAGRGGRRLALAGLAVAAVVIGLLATLLVTAWRADSPGETDPGAAASTTEPTSAAPAPSPPTNPEPPGTAAATIGEVDRALIEAMEAGAITRDGFDDLRDELGDLRDALTEDDPRKRDEKLREEAEDLVAEIEELIADGELDRATADQLIGLLDPLLT